MKKTNLGFLFLAFLLWAVAPCARSQENGSSPTTLSQGDSTGGTKTSPEASGILQDSSKIGPMEVWDLDMGMAMPFPTAHMHQSVLTLHGNGFFEAIAEEGVERGGGGFSAPNLLTA